MSHKGAFSEKDKIGVGLLFLHPGIDFAAANNGTHVCLLDCGVFHLPTQVNHTDECLCLGWNKKITSLFS